MSVTYSISGQFVDIHNREIYPASITILAGKIQKIERCEHAGDQFLLPGFVDAHIHIESSMLVPTEFARIAVTHGTVATVSDPHEIANVCGVAGVDYMINNAAQSALKFNFGAPSCVPATSFETAGAIITATDIAKLLERDDVKYLAEMMNFPGVLLKDEAVMAKIDAAKKAGKPIDGHAPGLLGAAALRYAAEGITTDHECTNLPEALDKIAAGMYILIREGSAAKNYEALSSLLTSHPGKVMFCSDDKHPDELLKGHINELVVRSIAKGYDLFDVLHAACKLPVLHYGLDVGLLREGDAADFIVVDNLKDFNVLKTFIDGALVAEDKQNLLPAVPVEAINNFSASPTTAKDFMLEVQENTDAITCRVIEALDGQLLTASCNKVLQVTDGEVQSDIQQDILKIGVVNRYHDAPVSIGFIRNFGLQQGALASSVAHDSHNIVFVGVDNQSISQAVNEIIKHKGGISVCDGAETFVMPLPVAGLMADTDAQKAAQQYQELDARAKALGSRLSAPFMTLSFMALPVIPQLKMTDKGLFDVDTFAFVNLLLNAEEAP